jgi:hypothetical protein
VYNEEQHRCREVAKQNKYKKEKGKVQRQTKETTKYHMGRRETSVGKRWATGGTRERETRHRQKMREKHNRAYWDNTTATTHLIHAHAKAQSTSHDRDQRPLIVPP